MREVRPLSNLGILSVRSVKCVILPAVIANKNIFLTKEVIKNEISLLLSKETMEKANTYIDQR